MSDVACFLLEHTAHARRGLRRYSSSSNPTIPPCPERMKYHNAITWIDTVDAPIVDNVIKYADGVQAIEPWLADRRWPDRCACGYQFGPLDEFQIFIEQLYKRSDNGELTTILDAGPGAMWDAWWLSDWSHYCGPDGKSLVVVLPNGHHWQIDGVASNCDAPCQDCGAPLSAHLATPATVPCRKLNPRPHKCWVRHGEPPNLTVDKNGVTCNAGAGSILSGTYHGFLRGGKLVSC